LLGDAVDVRADLFSIGVMLWEALAGQRLFNEPTAEAIVMLVIIAVASAAALKLLQRREINL